ncbi:MAG: S9 family peptidase, partial [Cellvibrionaceae bacterium]|nr:S9 family peptidase [Cellvibrionaceae bacterium]
MKKQLPHGSWPSPISATFVAEKSSRLAEPTLQCYRGNTRVFWLESLNQENGRTTIMLHSNGHSKSLLPAPFSCRSKVHEYGGGSYCVFENHLYFVAADDQRVYQVDIEQATPKVEAVTPLSTLRFADLITDSTGKRIIAVAEDHKNFNKPENFLVCIPIKKSAAQHQSPRKSDLSKIHTIASGEDFYAYPRLHPDGKQLCWITWRNPDMPWDKTELWLAELGDDNQLSNKKQLLKNTPRASIFQPHWSPKGELFFVSDADNWWNIYYISRHELGLQDGKAHKLTQLAAEFATPLWVFRMQTFGFLDADTLIACYTDKGRWHLAKIDLQNPELLNIQTTDYDDISAICAAQNQAVFLAANPSLSPSLAIATDKINLLIKSQINIDKKYISLPQAVSFPTSENDTAHAFYYPPTNAEAEFSAA